MHISCVEFHWLKKKNDQMSDIEMLFDASRKITVTSVTQSLFRWSQFCFVISKCGEEILFLSEDNIKIYSYVWYNEPDE